MNEADPTGKYQYEPVPTNWVGIEDLLYHCPEHREYISTLDEADLARVAEKLGEALADTYGIALPIVLEDMMKADQARE